jgi:hypothetical protein
MAYLQLLRGVETYRAGLLGFLFEERTQQLLAHVPHHLTDIGPYLWGLGLEYTVPADGHSRRVRRQNRSQDFHASPLGLITIMASTHGSEQDCVAMVVQELALSFGERADIQHARGRDTHAV